MRTQLPYRVPADRHLVNVYEPWEEIYWGEKLACTSQQLRMAVDAVGMAVTDVKKYLEQTRRGSRLGC
jgi:hypothetical protein